MSSVAATLFSLIMPMRWQLPPSPTPRPMKFIDHHRLVPKGGGYRERDLTGPLSLDPGDAAGFVARVRRRTKALMAAAEAEIENR